MGTYRVEGIKWAGGKIKNPLSLDADALKRMANLRLLHINCEIYLPMDLKLPSKKLRIL